MKPMTPQLKEAMDLLQKARQVLALFDGENPNTKYEYALASEMWERIWNFQKRWSKSRKQPQ